MVKFVALNLIGKKVADKWPPPPKVKEYTKDGKEIIDETMSHLKADAVVASGAQVGDDTTKLLYRGIGLEDGSQSSKADSEDAFKLSGVTNNFGLLKPDPDHPSGASSHTIHSSSHTHGLKAAKPLEETGHPQTPLKKQLAFTDDLKRKKFLKPAPKMPRLALWEYLRAWDVVRLIFN